MGSHPFALKGMLISLIKDAIIGFTPSFVLFQYNPSTLTRSIVPYNPFTSDEQPTIAPTVQPNDPTETIELVLELDAADELEGNWTLGMAFGVAPRIAALEKMTQPSQGLLGDLVETVGEIGEAFGEEAPWEPKERPSVPVTLFIWGPARFVPVRVTAYSIEEQLFSPVLYPLQATVSVTMEVLQPASFLCEDNLIIKFAKALYQLNRLQQDTLAIAQIANTVYDFGQQFDIIGP